MKFAFAAIMTFGKLVGGKRGFLGVVRKNQGRLWRFRLD